ncbi:MAG: AraC family transcriptional regulator [Oscillospiraceae bacterium]|nr:AraC family transcriptional regulator [Oscillospiraceae bacterium]
MDILTQLNRAMAYIEAHIADDLALADVASVTTYSPYHFGRLFYYVADMPLSEYIRRRKLSLAAQRLQGDGAKVIDLAVLYGYDSADSFTRAFVKQHAVTPSAARQAGVRLTIFPPLTFQIKIEGVRAMNWRMEECGAFEVFGIERVFGNDESGKVPGLWDESFANGAYERLRQAAGAKNGEAPRKDGRHGVNAVCGYRDTGGDSFPYMLCALRTSDSDTNGFTVARIPKATWAVFRSDVVEHIGTEIPGLLRRANSEWLPSSGYDRGAGPDMEMYYDAPDGRHFEEVWIPVKKA